MSHGGEVVTAVILIVACVVTLGIMVRMGNGMVLPQRIFCVATWWTSMKWTALVTAVASVAALAAAREISIAVFSVGVGALLVEAMLMSCARTFGPKE
jgi:hypothetical protein